jgi:hypothetical protein
MTDAPEGPATVHVHLRGFTDAEAKEFQAYLREQEGVEDTHRLLVKFASVVHIVPIAVVVAKYVGTAASGWVAKLAQDWMTTKVNEKRPPQQNLWVDSGSGRRPNV